MLLVRAEAPRRVVERSMHLSFAVLNPRTSALIRGRFLPFRSRRSRCDHGDSPGLLRCCIRKPLLTAHAIPVSPQFPPLPPFPPCFKGFGFELGFLATCPACRGFWHFWQFLPPRPPFLCRGPQQARCWLDGVICVSKVLRSPSRVAPEMQPGATKLCHTVKSQRRRREMS